MKKLNAKKKHNFSDLPRFIPVDKLLKDPEFENIHPDDLKKWLKASKAIHVTDDQVRLSKWLKDLRPVIIDGYGFASLNGLHIALAIVEKVLYMDRVEFRLWLKVQSMRQKIMRQNIRETNRS